MVKNLVIVESPAKAKTIEGYLGKDFIVKSSFGHVRDLPKDNNAIDISNGFKPTYVVSADKREIISQLKKLAKEAETVWLASDDDREGEAISWHLAETLNLSDQKTRRIVFREITKNAILTAIDNPREIDLNLVNAQQARRVLDRLVGFELSPVLWKKVKAGLSAGRVQSVAVRLVVEREREISQFKTSSAYRIVARFDAGRGAVLEAELPTRYKTRDEAEAFLARCVGAGYRIENLEKKPGKRSPAPPFTTSTLQQEASRKLGFSVAQTMSVAQKLYEAGRISYMRTDSVNLSQDALAAARVAISQAYGEEYAQTRQFKTKSASAQEAHEAIRPTDFALVKAGEDSAEQRLYDLIRKRALASQMADAVIERTVATIGISTQPGVMLTATGEVITFEGFLKAYAESKDEDEQDGESSFSRGLPPLSVGQELPLQQLRATERYSAPAARYTEASLVKKLEEMGIGRPSTYAPTISTIQKRGYVEKDTREGKERKFHVLTLEGSEVKTEVKTETFGADKAKLFPTDTAMVVTDFLVEHFPVIVDFQFTAKVEDEFDRIADGQEVWTDMLAGFYGTFHETVERGQDIERSTLGSTREIGTHPETGQKITARLGRFGPYVQIEPLEGAPEGEKAVYASLRKGQFIENLTVEEALDLFKLPRNVGQFEDKDMTAALGRFGPYIRHDSKFYSLTKEQDPHTITAQEAIDLIEAKRKADSERLIKTFPDREDVQVLNGRFGPYIVVGKKNVKIPKGEEPVELSLERCLELAEATPDKPAKGGRFAKKAAPAAAEKADTPAKKPAAKKPAAKKAAAKKPAAKKPATKAK
ncbi:type I DNA topoisomerase [Hymenobacter lutimineralis]|uniref:DNA topoisomerase 1 n=1 Tax=Hymenobacter lutimineralis TaxID=2606448 RepID=A0A5D6UUG9_9BACT|nr:MULTISPECIES: type I DNA topoisomerase [Hymenobacter]QIX63104.1 type I DNA topoisomerase [Hymenobacter sp. BT18]TYZ05979.1 type I DNA topoisomerase [Hymenobacter lutimineralis]